MVPAGLIREAGVVQTARGGRLPDRRRCLAVLHQGGDVGGDGHIGRRPAVEPPGEALKRRLVGLRGVRGDRGLEGGAQAGPRRPW